MTLEYRSEIYADSLAMRQLVKAKGYLPVTRAPAWPEQVDDTTRQRRETERLKKARHRANKKANPAA